MGIATDRLDRLLDSIRDRLDPDIYNDCDLSFGLGHDGHIEVRATGNADTLRVIAGEMDKAKADIEQLQNEINSVMGAA